MAEYLLRHRAATDGLPVLTLSAGLMLVGHPPPPHALKVLKAKGIDASGHRSQLLTAELIAASDLVVGMTGRHAKEAAIVDMSAARRVGTLKEWAHRFGASPRPGDQELGDYLDSVSHGGSIATVGSGGPAYDIDDPYGRRKKFYVRALGEIDAAVSQVVDGLFSEGP